MTQTRDISAIVNDQPRRATVEHARRAGRGSFAKSSIDGHSRRLRARRLRRLHRAGGWRGRPGCLLAGRPGKRRSRSKTVESLAPDPEAPQSSSRPSSSGNHGVQCGFCTGGMLMSLTAALRDNPRPTEAEIRDTLAGHLCRCTGYQGMVDAVLRWSGRAESPSEKRSHSRNVQRGRLSGAVYISSRVPFANPSAALAALWPPRTRRAEG